jgi:hypothetical protein
LANRVRKPRRTTSWSSTIRRRAGIILIRPHNVLVGALTVPLGRFLRHTLNPVSE